MAGAAGRAGSMAPADGIGGSDAASAHHGNHTERRADARGACFPSELRPRTNAGQNGNGASAELVIEMSLRVRTMTGTAPAPVMS
jgi:hypothetical protein